MSLRYGSVCSGVEAASLAWEPLGFKPVFFSEIEPFPSAVLAERWPEVPNLGDMTKFQEWKYEAGAIDVLVGGTPCQSFSVAGLRAGLDDDRGNLALVYARILERLRPKFFVWENVPGVLSSNGGRDFASILGAFQELGYGWAYRILDAQYFGVPQRRRRVFVVGCLGDWRRAAAVLFERESLSGNSQASGKAEQADTGCSDDGSDVECAECGVIWESEGQLEWCPVCGNLVRKYSPKISGCLETTSNDYSRSDVASCTFLVQGPHNHLGLNSGRESAVAFAENSRGEVRLEGGDGTRTGAVSHGGGKPGQGYPAVAGSIGVRRLTPRECERLQGFPDDHTLITYRGKPAADGPRYKAIGNSMAVPCMAWIGKRIKEVNDRMRYT